MKIRLSSRKSALAQAQAYQVGRVLRERHPHLEVEYLFRESLGDKNLTDPLWKMPEKGVFTQDFFQDLIENRTDMVVHSWKDLPTETNPHTQIAATLKRADQRDLFLLKKQSVGKKSIQIFSSSPRRAHNLMPFFQQALPGSVQKVDFQNVRGNIQTRIQKLLDANEVDGLVLAKAALDRLLVDNHFPDVQNFLRKALEKLNWMVLPLGENPNAAAQGALAIEVSNLRPEILELVKAINCTESFFTAQREREILKEFGGGCHLALGMSVLKRPYGHIEIVRGLTPENQPIAKKTFYPAKKRDQKMTVLRLEFEIAREAVNLDQKTDAQAFLVAKAEAIQNITSELKSRMNQAVVWTAGFQTWKKLAAENIWVHGSQEGLGEQESPLIEILAGQSLKWVRLTHNAAESSGEIPSIGTYQLKLTLKNSTLPQEDSAQSAYVWKSGSEFLLALQRFPELKNRFHICGPGRTYDTIRMHLQNDQNIFVELSDGFITVI